MGITSKSKKKGGRYTPPTRTRSIPRGSTEESIPITATDIPEDCFEAALKLMACLPDEWGPVIAHGIPTGQGGRPKGLRYWHAWVEVQHPQTGHWIALDYSHGLTTQMPRGRYYSLGQTKAHEIWRFDLAEAIEAMETFDTMGPWVDGWADKVDVKSEG